MLKSESVNHRGHRVTRGKTGNNLFSEYFFLQKLRCGGIQALTDEHRVALLIDQDRALLGAPGMLATSAS
jgi:hypothetical protein